MAQNEVSWTNTFYGRGISPHQFGIISSGNFKSKITSTVSKDTNACMFYILATAHRKL